MQAKGSHVVCLLNWIVSRFVNSSISEIATLQRYTPKGVVEGIAWSYGVIVLFAFGMNWYTIYQTEKSISAIQTLFLG